MDKKVKKRLEVLHQRAQRLQQQLAGARRQVDDPEEVRRLQREVQQLHEEIERLKSSG
jgi:hypothetical protein